MSDDMKAVIRCAGLVIVCAWLTKWIQGDLAVIDGFRALLALLMALVTGYFCVAAFASFVDWWGARRGRTW